jgi:hypothetical protein
MELGDISPLRGFANQQKISRKEAISTYPLLPISKEVTYWEGTARHNNSS